MTVSEMPRKSFPREYYDGAVFIPHHLMETIDGNLLFKIANFCFGYGGIERRHWKQLKKVDLAEEYHLEEDDVIKILKSKTPQKFPNQTQTCDWCTGSTCVLHAHHYPIRKSKGGQNTVNICPSCHCEFHFLLDKKHYRIKKEIKDEFDKAIEERERILKSFEAV